MQHARGLALLLALAASCGDGNGGSRPGGGGGQDQTGGGAGGGFDGSAGSAGSAGGAGSGGSGAGGTAGWVIPSCLADLMRTCPTSGMCREARDPDGANHRICYASGVKVTTPSSSCSAGGRSLTRVTKPDGSLCYTLEESGVTMGMACENGSYTWRDAANKVVATGGFAGGLGGRYLMVVCPGTGEQNTCSTAAECPDRSDFPFGVLCEQGGCPGP